MADNDVVVDTGNEGGSGDEIADDPVTSRAMGAFLGLCIGDAAGRPLEHIGRCPTAEEARVCTTLDGVADGVVQITDDSELAICLAEGLIEGTVSDDDGAAVVDFNPVARRFVLWVNTPPSDCGVTCGNALLACRRLSTEEGHDDASLFAATMRRGAMFLNKTSKANGSLMRAAPLAIWGHRLADDELAACARAHSSLTHPNPTNADAEAAWLIALAEVISGGSNEAALSRARAWVADHANDEVQAWFADVDAGITPEFYPMSGFIKIAFINAMLHLQRGTPVLEAIAETLAGGGDTDTNAAIVGALCGAHNMGTEGSDAGRDGKGEGGGDEEAPVDWSVPDSAGDIVERLMNRATVGDHRKVPPWMRVTQVPAIVVRLLACAPRSLASITGGIDDEASA